MLLNNRVCSCLLSARTRSTTLLWIAKKGPKTITISRELLSSLGARELPTLEQGVERCPENHCSLKLRRLNASTMNGISVMRTQPSANFMGTVGWRSQRCHGAGCLRSIVQAFGSSPYVGLQFDQSHLLWQMMDPIQAARDFADKIYDVHLKDTEIRWPILRKVGIDPRNNEQWW